MYLALQKDAEAAADFTKVIELKPKQSTLISAGARRKLSSAI